jgi:hypothetical protein
VALFTWGISGKSFRGRAGSCVVKIREGKNRRNIALQGVPETWEWWWYEKPLCTCVLGRKF